MHIRSTEYKSTPDHSFMALSKGIEHNFTRVTRQQANGKAYRLIKKIIEIWNAKHIFDSRQNRRIALVRFVNFLTL